MSDVSYSVAGHTRRKTWISARWPFVEDKSMTSPDKINTHAIQSSPEICVNSRRLNVGELNLRAVVD